ncbi:TPA: hypothetical protein ACIWEK_003432 [Salmonella enterica subsp. enterica serovar Enteritidis]
MCCIKDKKSVVKEIRSVRLWERFEGAVHDNGQQMTNISQDAITALETAEKRITELEAKLANPAPVSKTNKLDGAHFKPVADLYALCWEPGDVVTYTPDSEKASIWLNNYSGTCVQEYVKLERFQGVASGNSPVIPDDWVMVPKKLTAENGAKNVLSGEFLETTFISCPECFADEECESCDGSGRIKIEVPVSWTTIKAISIKGVEHFVVAPQQGTTNL